MSPDLENQLSAEEKKLLKEAQYQGGGGMMVDGITMEVLLEELASLRLLRELKKDEQEGGYD